MKLPIHFSRLKKYSGSAAVVICGLLLYATRESMPPGTDLVGALIALFGLGKQIEGGVADRIQERIGVLAARQAEHGKRIEDLREIADDHATHLERFQPYLKTLGCPAAKVLRPAS